MPDFAHHLAPADAAPRGPQAATYDIAACRCDGVHDDCPIPGHDPMPPEWKNDPIGCSHLKYLKLSDAELEALVAAGLSNPGIEFVRGLKGM